MRTKLWALDLMFESVGGRESETEWASERARERERERERGGGGEEGEA